jgi:hypothetical protein
LIQLEYPTRLIAENTGADSSMIIGKFLEQGDVNRGLRCPDRQLYRYGEGRHH